MPHRLTAGRPMSMKEVAARLGISLSTVKRWREEDPPAPFQRHAFFFTRWETDPHELRQWLLERAARHGAALSH